MTEGKGIKIEMHQTDKADIVEDSNGKLSISVSLNFKRRSGRCLITLPDGFVQEPRPWDTFITPLQSALARGYHWLQMLESGEAESMRDLANNEGVDNSYVSRMINLTLLAPDIVEAILDDRLPPELTLFELAVDPLRLWCEQERGLITNET